MKSLAELAALRQKSLDRLNMRNEESERERIVVGMATCGIAAGARPVMNTFVEEINTRNLNDVSVIPNWVGEQTEIDLKISFSMRIWHLFDIVFRVLARAIKHFFKDMKQKSPQHPQPSGSIVRKH